MNHGFIIRTIQFRKHVGKEQHECLLISELTPNSHLSSEGEALPETRELSFISFCPGK